MLARLLRRILYNQMRIMHALNVLLSMSKDPRSAETTKAGQYLLDAMELSQGDYEDTRP